MATAAARATRARTWARVAVAGINPSSSDDRVLETWLTAANDLAASSMQDITLVVAGIVGLGVLRIGRADACLPRSNSVNCGPIAPHEELQRSSRPVLPQRADGRWGP